LRKTLAEPPFWDDQAVVRLHRFLLKGLAKVQCEWSLTTLACNLKRVLNLVGFERLMAAGAENPAATPARKKRRPVIWITRHVTGMCEPNSVNEKLLNKILPRSQPSIPLPTNCFTRLGALRRPVTHEVNRQRS